MKSRKVWKLVQLLSSQEKLLFQDWLKGVLHGTQPEVYNLYEGMLLHSQTPMIWNYIYPGKPLREDRFSYLCNQLSEKICDFIAWQSFQSEKYSKDLYLVRELNKRGAIDVLQKKWNQILKKMHNSPERDSNYFLAYDKMHMERTHFLFKHPDRLKKMEPSQYPNPYELHWTQEFLYRGLKHLDEGSGEEWIFQLLGILQQQVNEDSPILTQVFSQLYSLFAHSEGNIKSIIELVRNNESRFGSRDLLVNIINLLMNYFTRRSNRFGKREDLAGLFEVYLWGIEDRLLFVDGFLPHQYFNTLVTLGIRLKKYTEVSQYIEFFKDFLPKAQRAETYAFNQGYFYFEQKKFTQSKRIFSQKFSYENYEARARFMLSQILYEEGERVDILPILRNLKRYVNSQKNLNPNAKKGFGNSIDAFRQLIRAFLPEEYQKLSDSIREVRPLLSKEWLMAKCEENF